MNHRFHFLPVSPAETILRHATAVKIELRRIGGLVGVEYTIEGGVCPGLDDDDEDDQEEGGAVAEREQVDPAELAREVFEAFVNSTAKQGRG